MQISSLRRSEQDGCMPFGLRCGIRSLRRRPAAFLALSWAIGAAAGYASEVPWQIWLVPTLLFAALTVWRKRAVCLCAVFLFLSALLVGALSEQPEPIERQRVSLTGTICTEPRYYDDYAMLTLNAVGIDGARYPYRLRLYLYRNGGEIPALQYGDTIETEANVSSPKGVTGDGAYDTASYLWRNGVALTGNASALDTIWTPGASSPMRTIMALRASLGELLDQMYPEYNGLAHALLLGDKSMLSDVEYDSFRDAGIVHILAVSGLHITVLAEAVRLFLRKALRLSRRTAYWVVLPFLLVYAAVTGFPASVLRATICFALMDAAPLFGRPSDQLTGLAVAFLLLCWRNPLSAFDAGFQLSFSAMLGLCLIAPVFSAALIPAKAQENALQRALWSPLQMILASLSAALGTLPVAASLFGGLTLWSLFANILAIPLTTVTMPLLLASLLIRPVSVPGNWGLTLLNALALRLGSLPEKLYVSLPQMSWTFILCYAVIALLCSAQFPLRRLSRRAAMRLKAAGTLLLVAVALLSSAWSKAPILNESGLVITFLDVGQGDSALINAQGTCYMVDTGDNRAAENRLTSRSIQLEALFLTHPDSDHAGAAASVIRAGHVQTVYLPECWNLLEVPEEMTSALNSCEVHYLSAGDTVSLSDDVRATVLHPPKDYLPESDNAASLVLLIEYGSGSALMLGDLPDTAIDFSIPDCDVIKLAHHGSESSSGARLLLGSSPSAAILSVGQNSYGHPGLGVLQRLDANNIPYFRTDERGDIAVSVLPSGGLIIDCWLDEEMEAG